MKQIFPVGRMTTGSIIVIMTAMFIVLAARFIASVKYLIASACRWLNTRHDLSNEEGPIHLTGWQYLGICTLVTVVCVALSIQF